MTANHPSACAWFHREATADASRTAGSGQGNLQHPQRLAYRCSLPGLTGFTSVRRRGLDPQRHLSTADSTPASLRKPFGSTIAGCGSRGPLAPHLAQAVAEGAGFEPAVPEGTPVLQTGGLDRSPTPPRNLLILGMRVTDFNDPEHSRSLPRGKSRIVHRLPGLYFIASPDRKLRNPWYNKHNGWIE